MNRDAQAWISEADLTQARAASPEAILRNHFSEVSKQRNGRTLIVPPILRVDFRDGRWVSCDWSGSGIGDSIALVRRVLGCSFAEAVGQLLRHEVEGTRRLPVERSSTPTDRPRLPHAADPSRGRAYLANRSLGLEVIVAAETCGALRYAQDGVVFVGVDRLGAVRSATVRYLTPKLMPDGSQMTKRDLKGSNKEYPVVFDGDPERVVIVEGAISGLAAQSLSELAGRRRPTTVVTGGVNTLRWISQTNSTASALAVRAVELTLIAENEVGADGLRDTGKQFRTDAARSKVIQVLSAARNGVPPRLVYPPAEIKDAAEWLDRLSCSTGS